MNLLYHQCPGFLFIFLNPPKPGLVLATLTANLFLCLGVGVFHESFPHILGRVLGKGGSPCLQCKVPRPFGQFAESSMSPCDCGYKTRSRTTVNETRGVFVPPFVREWATPSTRNHYKGVDHFSTKGGKKTPWMKPQLKP